MNCPMCEKGLISVGMVKDRSGYPTFTLRCPEHGNIGKNTFKQGFLRTFFQSSRPIEEGTSLHTWNHLIRALVQIASEGSAANFAAHTEYDRLRLRADNGTLASYLIEVLQSLANAVGAEDSPEHTEIGACGVCNGRTLFNRGFRIRGRTSEWLSPGPPYIVDRLMNAINAAQEEPSW